MSADHAAVVREALTHDPPYAESDDATALLALDALVAERDRWRAVACNVKEQGDALKAAERERDEAREELRKWEGHIYPHTYAQALAQVVALREALEQIEWYDNGFAAGVARAALARVTPTEEEQ